MRWLSALRPVAGLAWFAALVLPWFLAIVMRAGDSFFAESIGQDLLAKVTSGQESHGAPPGYYLVLFWVTFWPGAMLAGLAAPAILAARREPGAKFLLAWMVPSWIVLELVVTKLPHYVLPLYPAIAILIAGIMDARMLSRAHLARAWDDVVVRNSLARRRRGHCGAHLHRSAIRIAGLAGHRGSRNHGLAGVATL